MNYLELLRCAVPETIVVLTALAVLAIDLISMRAAETRLRFVIGGMMACVGCAAAIVWMIVLPETVGSLGGMLVMDPLTQFVKIALLVLTIFTVLISMDSTFTDHVGEYDGYFYFFAHSRPLYLIWAFTRRPLSPSMRGLVLR